MTNSPVQTIAAADLSALMADVLARLDVAPDDIPLVVEALMEATLSGYDSHGVMRLPRYADDLRQGTIMARGAFTILRQTAATAHVDGGRALGAVTATRALDLACRKAAAVGIGCVSTRNSNDIGRLGSYLRQPAQQGFLTLLAVNDSGGLPTVAAHGGAARFFSTNPLAAGIPRAQAEPIIIDMSTSMTSVGRLRMDAQRGASIPAGWLIDSQGEAVIDPARFFEHPNETFLLPLGGMLAGHKGFALQLLIDVLAGALGGAGVATGTDPGLEANALFVLAIDPDHFASRETFVELISTMVAGLKNTPTLPHTEAVRIPGERAAQERQARRRAGIPLSAVTRDELGSLIASLGLEHKYAKLFS